MTKGGRLGDFYRILEKRFELDPWDDTEFPIPRDIWDQAMSAMKWREVYIAKLFEDKKLADFLEMVLFDLNYRIIGDRLITDNKTLYEFVNWIRNNEELVKLAIEVYGEDELIGNVETVSQIWSRVKQFLSRLP